MVSLLDFSSINEHGVRFRNPHNGRSRGTLLLSRMESQSSPFLHPDLSDPGEEMMLTPEHSIRLQNMIGADIMMQLDDVVSSLSQDKARIGSTISQSCSVWTDGLES